MNKQYWLRGGLLACALAVAWFAILMLGWQTTFPDEFLLYFFPAMFFVAMDVSMCGNNCPSDAETWVYTIGAGIISLALYFIIGAFLGYIYGKMVRPNT